MKTIKDELVALEDSQRIIHAERVVEWAKVNKKSLLHQQFTWDDSVAGHQYRLYEARRIIALNVVSEDRKPEIVSLVVDRNKGGGYRRIDDVVQSLDLSTHLLDDALQELNRVKAKYQFVKELVSVWDELDKVKTKRDTAKERRATA